MAGSGTGRQKKYLIEFHTVGNSVKVSAIDPDSLLEVSIVGPFTVSEAELSRLAVRKLEYVMRKRTERPDNRPGIKV